MEQLDQQWAAWEKQFGAFLLAGRSDVAHDLEHIQRVVASAVLLARAEQADLAIVLPAAWLHDCVLVPKNDPRRSQVSLLAAERAGDFLRQIDYPSQYLEPIQHAIAAHSFSAQIAPQTREAMVVQDADRLDALGAIGLARCLMVGGMLGRQLYHPDEPFPRTRQPDERQNTLDHCYQKLLLLTDQMQTVSGRAEAQLRTAFLTSFLAQLELELRPRYALRDKAL